MALHVSICSTKGIQYVRVCESYRNSSGEPRTKTLESHGQLKKLLEKDPLYVEKLRARVAKENESLRQARLEGLEASARERIEKLQNKLKEHKAEQRHAFRKLNVGTALLRKVWKDLSMPQFFSSASEKRKSRYNYDRVAFLLSAQRIIKPSSKLQVYEDKDKSIVAMDSVTDINQLYRVLDALSEDKESLVRHLNREIGKKIDRKLTLAFYDVTTYAFESRKENELLGFGLSKDHKVNEVQVVLGLVMDENGIPLDYELFAGSTNEFGTMLPLIKKLKKTYAIGQLIVVADRGLNSSENLLALKDLGCDFVIAQKVKNCSEQERAVILDQSNWSSMSVSEEGELLCRYKKLETDKTLYETKTSKKTGRNYKTKKVIATMPVSWVVTYAPHRAQKDLGDVNRAIEKATKAINTGNGLSNNKGYRSYIQIPRSNGEAKLNLEKIQEDKKWAGYYAVCTTLKTKTSEQVMAIYRKLWQIEDCFRVSKTQLETRPCFVWTEAHIRGHFVSCFTSLVIEKYMLYVLKKALGKEAITAEAFCEAIREAEVVYDDSDMQTPLLLRLYESGLFDAMSKVFGLQALNRAEQPYMARRKLHLSSINV